MHCPPLRTKKDNDPGMLYSPPQTSSRKLITPPESPRSTVNKNRANARSSCSSLRNSGWDTPSFAGTPRDFWTQRGDHLERQSGKYRTRHSKDHFDKSSPLLHYHKQIYDTLQHFHQPVHAVAEHEAKRAEREEMRRELSDLALHTKETNLILMDFNLSLEDVKAALSMPK